jgi:hypothetical protein
VSMEPQSQDHVDILMEIAEERALSLTSAESADLFARIERDIERDGREERPRLRLLPFGGAGVTVTILAAAAAFVLMFGRRNVEPTQVAGPTPAQLGSEILEVDFGSNAGTHFSVEGEHGQRLAVVWIDDWESL